MKPSAAPQPSPSPSQQQIKQRLHQSACDNTSSHTAGGEQEMEAIEVMDIEDVVPYGGNCLFLCVARGLILMAHKSAAFMDALVHCCGIQRADLNSDIRLQTLLRVRLCEYLSQHGLVYDRSKRRMVLSAEYANHFNDNVYDFVVQLCQLGINNFSNNALFRKYALSTLSRLLHMNFACKRLNGEWKNCDPSGRGRVFEKAAAAHADGVSKPVHCHQQCTAAAAATEQSFDHAHTVQCPACLAVLHDSIIYLQEFRFDHAAAAAAASAVTVTAAICNGSAGSASSVDAVSAVGAGVKWHASSMYNPRSVRLLMSKPLWLKRNAENSKICLKYAQFSDPNELRAFMTPHYCVEPMRIVRRLITAEETAATASASGGSSVGAAITPRRVFLVFMCLAPVHLLAYAAQLNTPGSGGAMTDKQQQQQHASSCSSIDPHAISEFAYSVEYNTLGKQIARFEQAASSLLTLSSSSSSSLSGNGSERLINYLNHVWGKRFLTEAMVAKAFVSYCNSAHAGITPPSINVPATSNVATTVAPVH